MFNKEMRVIFIEHIEFTSDEMDGVELAKDLCDEMQAGGESITCFDVLSKLLGQGITIKQNREEVLAAYLQLTQYNKFWSEAEWFNNNHMETLATKLRSLLKSEIN
ncbi:hypothetical protein ABEW34_11845 [Paenibacillus algorifonticola]|uniref:hypothetical protein n=1 Tax=Paenibacillus algorifonticola TaxID=684063 RepID=UPI003D28CAB3